jgi:LysM repeat protein
MARLMRGLGSLVVLLLGTAGAPVALAFLGGNPLPEELTWSAVRQALFAPADGMILVGLITIVGWLAWLIFTLSVISELVAVMSRQRIRIRLPGLDVPQRYAAGLLISVITMISAPHAVQADPHSDRQVAAAPRAPEPAALIIEPIEAATHSPGPAAPRADVDDVHRRHVVEAGDDLWSLAERYYGNGREWRTIAEANPTVLTGGPDRLQVGWRLKIPDPDAGVAGDRVITVRRGDTLSSIAERELGATTRWTDVFQANRAQLADPDELAVGMRLLVPQPERPEAEATPKTTPKVHDRHRSTEASPAEPPPPPAPSEPSAPPSQPARSPSSQPDENAPTAATDPAPAVDLPAVSLVGVGGLLAAGVIAGLAWRRRIQLQTRPPGRRIVHPPPPTRTVEVALGRRQRPLSLRTLDRATRAIAAHCKDSDVPPPPLQLALIGEKEIELRMREPCATAPVGFTVRGRSWFLAQTDVDYVKSVPGLSEAARPWPALVTLGRDEHDRLVLGDLESFGLLELQPDTGFPATDLLAAMAVELSFSPWADEMILTLVGGGERLPEALGKHNVYRTDDCDELLTRLEQRAAVQREHRRYPVLSQHRVDPDFADPWAPEIVLVEQPLTAAQSMRLRALVDAEPKVTVAAVVVGPVPGAEWSLRGDGSSDRRVVLQPDGLSLCPQWLESAELTAVVDLIETTGSDDTTPAPWWSDIGVQPDPPPDNVTYLDSRSTTWGTASTAERALIMEAAMDPDRTVHHPILQMLGPIELRGATGTEPARAAKQCLEYCAWLLENPGSTAQAMVAALAVAEGTRRSNMSRLRSWLGASAAGDAYLPDAYTGRIALHPAVSSDWQRLQILTATGVNRASDDTLQAALELVRGAPLADAAPGQWHWAEELRTDMICCVRDIGVELADRALLAGDVERARWAAARALLAAPGDELLLATRIRTEHTAGNAAETERLTLQLAAQARTLGVDLDPETVSLLQEVMEGQVRARLA